MGGSYQGPTSCYFLLLFVGQVSYERVRYRARSLQARGVLSRTLRGPIKDLSISCLARMILLKAFRN